MTQNPGFFAAVDFLRMGTRPVSDHPTQAFEPANVHPLGKVVLDPDHKFDEKPDQE
jgi:hypothetical protein